MTRFGSPMSARSGLLRYVRPKEEGAPPSDGARSRLRSAHIYRENQISNLAFIYTCAKILLFLY